MTRQSMGFWAGAVFVAGLVVAGMLGLRAWREHQLTEEKVAALPGFSFAFSRRTSSGICSPFSCQRLRMPLQ